MCKDVSGGNMIDAIYGAICGFLYLYGFVTICVEICANMCQCYLTRMLLQKNMYEDTLVCPAWWTMVKLLRDLNSWGAEVLTRVGPKFVKQALRLCAFLNFLCWIGLSCARWCLSMPFHAFRDFVSMLAGPDTVSRRLQGWYQVSAPEKVKTWQKHTKTTFKTT